MTIQKTINPFFLKAAGILTVQEINDYTKAFSEKKPSDHMRLLKRMELHFANLPPDFKREDTILYYNLLNNIILSLQSSVKGIEKYSERFKDVKKNMWVITRKAINANDESDEFLEKVENLVSNLSTLLTLISPFIKTIVPVSIMIINN